MSGINYILGFWKAFTLCNITNNATLANASGFSDVANISPKVGSGGRAVERRTVNRGDGGNPTYRRFET